MPTILPLSSFLPGVLMGAYGWPYIGGTRPSAVYGGGSGDYVAPPVGVISGRLSPGRSASGKIRQFGEPIGQPQAAPGRFASGPITGEMNNLLAGEPTPEDLLMRQAGIGPPTSAANLNPPPPMNAPQSFALQDMGEFPPSPVYPAVLPDTAQTTASANVPRGATAEDFMNPARQPTSQDFGVQPAQAQPAQQPGLLSGGMSDAGMWGLIAAGLGILANNYGNYGQASPAIGRGGLIGLNTYLGQRQIGVENQAQQQRLEIARREQAAREQLYGAQMGNYQSEAELRRQQIENLKALEEAYKGVLDPNADISEQMKDPNTHYLVAGRLLRARNPGAAKQAMDTALALSNSSRKAEDEIIKESLPDNKVQEWRRSPQTGQMERWGAPYDRRGEPMKITVSPEIKTTETFNEMSSKEQAKELMDTYKSLQNIPDQIAVMNEAEKALKNAGGFVGSGAETKLAVAKFFNNNFGTDISSKEVANAELLRSTLFRQIMENLKKLDAQPSQQQQKVMQESLGNIGTDPNAIPEIIRITKQVLEKRARQHNKRVDEAIKNKAIFLYDIHIPGYEEPTGKDPWEK